MTNGTDKRKTYFDYTGQNLPGLSPYVKGTMGMGMHATAYLPEVYYRRGIRRFRLATNKLKVEVLNNVNLGLVRVWVSNKVSKFFRCLSDNLYVLRLDVSRPTCGHRFKIMLEHCTNDYRKNFFIQRVAPVWDSLPLAIVDFSSLPRFKRSLALVNLRIFLHVFNCLLFLAPCKWYIPAVASVVEALLLSLCAA